MKILGVCVCVCASVVASVCQYVRANDLVILNKVVLHIVSETVKAVCKKFVFYNLRGCI